MQQDGGRLNFSSESFRLMLATALGARNKMLCIMFEQNGALFPRSVEEQLDMKYVWCFKKREYIARLSSLVVLLKGASQFPDQVNLYTV